MDQGWSTLFGAVIGGGAAIGGAIAVETWKERTRAKQSAIASAAELEASLGVARVRGYREGIEAHLIAARGRQVVAFSVHLPQEVIPVTRAASKNPGPMPAELVKSLAKIVVLTDALMSDMQRTTTQGVVPSGGNFLSEDDPAFAVQFYSELLGFFDEWAEAIDRYVATVSRMYPAGK